MINTINKLLVKVSGFSAKAGAGSASIWNTYQPKEPQNIKKSK